MNLSVNHHNIRPLLYNSAMEKYTQGLVNGSSPVTISEGVKEAILKAVTDAGPNACPPMIVGVGIGGTFEKAALMAKQALTDPVGDDHSDKPSWVLDLEQEMLTKINNSGIGPAGLGGTTTALAVNVRTYPTHIAGLPVAVNICCHVNRHITVVL